MEQACINTESNLNAREDVAQPFMQAFCLSLNALKSATEKFAVASLADEFVSLLRGREMRGSPLDLWAVSFACTSPELQESEDRHLLWKFQYTQHQTIMVSIWCRKIQIALPEKK